MSGYRVVWYQAVTITAQELIDAFCEEWEAAKRLGLTEDEFAHDSIRECDFETLNELGSNHADNFEWEPV